MCFVWISDKLSIFALQIINWLLFIYKIESICEQDQQDAHFICFICFNYTVLYMFRTNKFFIRRVHLDTQHLVFPCMCRGADKSLARPGRKQATATEDFEFHISWGSVVVKALRY